MKKTFYVDVDCASCAGLCEDAIKKLDGVRSASINFILKKAIIEWDDAIDEKALLKSVKKACRKIEWGFDVRPI